MGDEFELLDEGDDDFPEKDGGGGGGGTDEEGPEFCIVCNSGSESVGR